MNRTLLVLTMLTAAGCKKQIDPAKAESSIKEGLEAKGLKIESVSCPKGKAAKKGESFDCTGKTGGKDFTVGVEQLDDEGNVKWKLKGYIVNSKDVVAKVGPTLGKGDKLTCADRPVTVETGSSSIDCDLTGVKIKIVFAEDGSMKAVPPDEPKHDEHKADEAKHDEDKKD